MLEAVFIKGDGVDGEEPSTQDPDSSKKDTTTEEQEEEDLAPGRKSGEMQIFVKKPDGVDVTGLMVDPEDYIVTVKGRVQNLLALDGVELKRRDFTLAGVGSTWTMTSPSRTTGSTSTPSWR